jgi:hypothetical protein
MFFVLDRFQRDRHVPLIRRADEDGIDLRIAAHLLIVGVEPDRLWEFCGKLLHSFWDLFAKRDHASSGVVCDPSAACPANAHAKDGSSDLVHIQTISPK